MLIPFQKQNYANAQSAAKGVMKKEEEPPKFDVSLALGGGGSINKSFKIIVSAIGV